MRHVVMAQEWIHGFVRTRVEVAKEQGDRGDWVSYLAVVIFIAALTAAVFAANIPAAITDGIKGGIASVVGNTPK